MTLHVDYLEEALDKEEFSEKYKRAIRLYILHGVGQARACEMAGLSRLTYKDVFENDRARNIIKEFKVEEIDPAKEELIQFYRRVINAPYNTPVNMLAPPGCLEKEFIGNYIVKETYRPPRLGEQRADNDDGKGGSKLIARTIQFRTVTETDRIAAAKELSILLGIREEKIKVNEEDNLIRTLQERREVLNGKKENTVQEDNV